jgi:resuscitation-promoting factor RpfB
LRRPLPICLCFAIAAAGLLRPVAALAQVPAPPAGAGQASSFVLDGNAAPVTTVAPTPSTKAPVKKAAKAKSAAATPTTIDVRPLDTATAPSAPAPAAASASAGGIPDSVWAALRKCESNGNYAINTGNGYYGAYQFAASTWRKLGYSGLPHEAAPAVQDEAARKLQASAGWGPWPACTRKLGLR